MRLLASTACLVLLVMGCLVFVDEALLARLGLAEPSRSAPQQVHIFSTGEGQLGALHGIRPIDNRMLVDGERYDLGLDAPAGLRVLEFPPGGSVGALQNYALASDLRELERLIERLESAPPDTAFALGVAGRIEPPKGAQWDEHRGRLQRFFESLGAQSQPASAGACGFAYLFVLRPGGIVPLAESFSSVQGVHLSFQLAQRRERYEGRAVQVANDERMSIFLAPGQATGEGLLQEPKLRLGPRGFNALSVPVTQAQPGLLSWRLGSDAGGPMSTPLRLSFETRLGLLPGVESAGGGVRFELLIDGELAAQRVLMDSLAGKLGWDLWSTTLDPELHSVDRVQLRMTRFGPEESPAQRAYLAQPRLIAGSTGSSGATGTAGAAGD